MSEQVLPFYVVCDESGSMSEALEGMNHSLPKLHTAIGGDPVVSDKTRLCLIGFAEDAQVLQPLADLSELSGLPSLTSRGLTSYRAVFDLLRRCIEQDVTKLKEDGHAVFRPAVFFMTDGNPTDDDWRQAYQQLVDPGWSYRPNVIAFGLTRDVDEEILASIATFKAFIGDGSEKPAQALQEFVRALTRSIVMSGRANAVGSDNQPSIELQVPNEIPGYTALPVDPL
jgi:uncharacterized protein YegL